MATARRSEYSRYDDVLDLVYSTRDWWRTIHILEHVLVFVAPPWPRRLWPRPTCT